MVNYNMAQLNNLQRPSINSLQAPQYINNTLLNNTPFDNYMGNRVENIPTNYLKGKTVSSKDQVKMCQIDLDGSPWVFTDLGHDKIYIKQFNSDGTTILKTYILAQNENPYAEMEYITKKDFQKAIENIKNMLENKILNDKESVQQQETLLNF